MMTLCLYGGSFDPVHKGHMYFAERITDTFKVDAFFFIPAHTSPFKSETKHTSDEHRLSMLEIACKNIPNSHVSSLEIDRKGLSYTIDTLKAFQELYPGHRMFWVIGDDHLATLEKWKGYPDHFHYCDFIILPRKVKDLKEQIETHPYRSQLHILPSDKIGVSSSVIRQALAENRPILSYVSQEINDYIRANNLYR
ncbi:MAG: nicotinate (nicotinamide) nucleotide adenylyltransferase [Candidatus Marinimicrobia bacterium]|nr:nicotinate (nicotinamide) nucleotide adenylyltransferase [Candidatus Neomarinimicrobiota bacterium]